jgi:hypothetical protein
MPKITFIISDSKHVSLESTTPFRCTESDENGNIIQVYDVVEDKTIAFANENEYSTEAALHIDKAEGRSCLNSLESCFTQNSNNYISSFLIKIFVSSIGAGGSPNSGVFCYDSKENLITISEFFILLLKKLAVGFQNETKEAKNEFIKRGKEIQSHFEYTKKLLIQSGWKERTPFSRQEQDKFTKIIKNRTYD